MMNMVVTTDEKRAHRHRTMHLHPWINLREKLRGWQTTAEISFSEELTDFVRLVHGQPSRVADGPAGLGAVAVAHAAYESSSTGTPVLVPQ